MWSCDRESKRALYVLGLGPDASLEDAKSAFRQHAKRLHPDHTPATPETLSQLASMIKSIRYLENSSKLDVAITISADEARRGISRTVTHKAKSGVFRIAPDTPSGTLISAIGDPTFFASIFVEAQPDIGACDRESGLNQFMNDFVKASPASRMAGWLRKARSAA